ncbi:MAG: Crp/Fnr family transcriptional regulator [Xanthobacteraceae bacterium]
MAKDKRTNDTLDPKRVLSGRGAGQSRLRLAPGQVIFAQGDFADALNYIESGLVKLAVVSPSGKEAVIALRGDGEFFGTWCLIKEHRRAATSTALTDCSLVRITAAAVIRMLREEPGFAEMFVTSLVSQHLRAQETLVDQLINSAEKRLARVLLQLANFGRAGNPGSIPTRINQAVLANTIGTTRPRVSFFMNKFRRQGFIEYDRHGYVTVRNSLRNVFLGR